MVLKNWVKYKNLKIKFLTKKNIRYYFYNSSKFNNLLQFLNKKLIIKFFVIHSNNNINIIRLQCILKKVNLQQHSMLVKLYLTNTLLKINLNLNNYIIYLK